MSQNKTSIFSGKKLIVFLHLFSWIVLFILPNYWLALEFGKDRFTDIFLIFISFAQVIAYAIVFYVNYLWLIPKLFFKNRKSIYFLSIIVLIIGIGFLFNLSRSDGPPMKYSPVENRMNIPQPHNDEPGHHPSMGRPTYDYFLISIIISGFGLGLRFSEKLVKNENQRKEAEKEKLNSELAFLKNQVSPHFFFNTLNNIYSLVQINSEDSQKAILQLSKLMRYLLYESNQGNTLLSHEINFMKNYIDLMKLRVSNKVDIDVTFPDKFDDIVIPPLLFIPFIENAFKHGISYQEPSYVKILMKMESGKLYFICNNSLKMAKDESILSDSGIGLENVKKRLKLLFPETHKLTIDQAVNSYNVNLIIDVLNNKDI
jgi:two-component system, LytTR family, sensor kinase